MPKYDLSVIIPARCEMFLQRTVDSVMEARRGATQVIVFADQDWPIAPGLKSHPDLTLINYSKTVIGQRAAINAGARISGAKYIMKLDGHCRMDEGFDVKLAADCEYEDVIVPRLYNLHAFDWKCKKCGLRTYQGPQPKHCSTCKADTEHIMRMVWEPRWNRITDSMRFDSDLHFQYWRMFNATASDIDKLNHRNEKSGEPLKHKFRPEGQLEISPTMSLLGACWFLHRERYWELGGSDEEHGSWGQQGTEIACKAWLSGGRLLVNKKVWYSHLFRTQPGFSFPYAISHSQTERAREYSKRFWREGRWSKAVMPLSALVEKFWPVPGWTPESLEQLKATEQGRRVQFAVAREIEQNPKHVQSAPDTGLTKGIVYYTENRCREPIFSVVQEQLKRVANGHQIISVSLKPINFGENYVLGLERSYETMFKQILMGISQSDADIIYFAEHDVLYAKEHFDFIPPRDDVYYYDEAVWRVSARTGQALFHYHRSTSMLVANRRLLIDHYRERIARVEKEGFSYRSGFEPGTRSLSHGGYDNFRAASFLSAVPSIDIRDTGTNLTKTNWSKDQYRNPKYTAGWTEGDSVPGWPGIIKDRFNDWLKEIMGKPE